MGKLKGFVYSLDVAISMVLFIAIITAIMFFYNTGSQVPDTSSVLMASDIISALDKQGVFDSLDTENIAAALNQELPGNLNMSMTLHVYGSDLDFEESRQVNTDLDGNYYSGKWLFIVGNITDADKFVFAEYRVGFI